MPGEQQSYVNKVIFGNDTLIDLTSDTVTASDLLSGVTAHDKSGAVIEGTCTYDADTSDADATSSHIITGKSAYVNGSKVNGSMPNKGGVTGTISDISTPYSIQAGYHDGSGTVDIDSTSKTNLTAGNLRSGVEILGVTGSYAGETVPTEECNVTPYTTAQTIVPTSGYNISQVNVAAITYTESSNSYGTTVTIGAVAPTT